MFSGAGSTAASAPKPSRASVLTKTVRGASFMVKVKTPAGGRITISSGAVKTVHKSVGRAGTWALRVGLTAKQQQLLARRHELKLKLHVSYAPAHSGATTATASLTVKPALRQRRSSKARRAANTTGRAGR